MLDLVVKNGTVINAKHSNKLDVGIKDGKILQVAGTIGTAIFAYILLAMAVEAYIFQPIFMWKRLALGVLALALFLPLSAFQYAWAVNLVALILSILFFAYEWLRRHSAAVTTAVNSRERL